MTLPVLAGLTVGDPTMLATLDEAVTRCEVNWAVGSVAQVTLELADQGRALSTAGLLGLGTTLTWGQATWQVGTVERDLTSWGATVTVAARSQLGKTLRLEAAKTGSTKRISPAAWIERRAQAAGGAAVVQPGARKRTITQKQGQTSLDVITALASTMEAEWVEADNALYVGTPYWAWQDNCGLPTWDVTWGVDPVTDALSLSGSLSDDNKTEAASCSLTLPFERGQDIRPWHRVAIEGVGEPFDGAWLVGDVSIDLLRSSTVSLTLTQPLKASIKRGSSGAKKSKSTSKPSGGSASAGSKGASASTPSTSRPSSGSRASNPVTRTPNLPTGATGGKRAPLAGSPGLTAGWRYPRGGFHGAYDYGVNRGTPVRAVRDGVVLACNDGVRNHARGSANNPGSGSPSNWILLGVMYGGRKATVYYQHLSPGLSVSKNDRVRAGQVIARSGNTGNSTGDHLHIECRWGWGPRYSGARIFPPSKVWQ